MLNGDCVAIDGSKFKAVNNRDRNFSTDKIASGLAHQEADVDRYNHHIVRIKAVPNILESKGVPTRLGL